MKTRLFLLTAIALLGNSETVLALPNDNNATPNSLFSVPIEWTVKMNNDGSSLTNYSNKEETILINITEGLANLLMSNPGNPCNKQDLLAGRNVTCTLLPTETLTFTYPYGDENDPHPIMVAKGTYQISQ